MPRPVCVPCGLEMRCEKNDKPIELQSCGKAYQIWVGDEYKCHNCETSVVIGFGNGPRVEHYESHYGNIRKTYEGDGIVIVHEWKDGS